MIYEFRTYTLFPRQLKSFMQQFEEALPARLEFSPLAAFWYTEIGPLNQVIHVWPYADAGERARIRAEAAASGKWPPKTANLIADMRSDILEPMPHAAPLQPGKIGPYYEMRTYGLRPGAAAGMSERWAAHIEGRLALSPLAGVFHSEMGQLNQWVHIWAYESLDQRAAVRAEAASKGIWPPPAPAGDSENPIVHQENKILLPASFSPMQ